MADRLRALAGPMTDDWYGSMFASAPASSLCGEITPAYALLPPEGVDHLLNLSPDVNILFLLRDPIERAWSQIRMHARSPMPYPAASLQLETGIDENVLARSRYSVTLRTYRARIDEDRLWIGDYDELREAPASLLASACAFLGLDFDDRHFPHLHERFLVGQAELADDAIYQHLRAALEPEYDALVDTLPDLARQWRARHYV